MVLKWRDTLYICKVTGGIFEGWVGQIETVTTGATAKSVPSGLMVEKSTEMRM